jgi:hypothetical protein
MGDACMHICTPPAMHISTNMHKCTSMHDADV